MTLANKQASAFHNGFATRLNQLVIKQASARNLVDDPEFQKCASGLARVLGRAVPHLGEAATHVPLSGRMAQGVGRFTGRLMATPAVALRNLVNPNRPAGMISHMVGGMGEGLLGAFGPRGRAWGQSFKNFATSPVRFGGSGSAAGSTAGRTMADALQARNPILGSSPEFAEGFARHHPSAIPGMVAPRGGTPNWTHMGGAPGEFGAREMRGARFSPGAGGGASAGSAGGAGAAGGSGGAGGGAAGGAAAAGAGGDPTGNLLNKIRGHLPDRVNNWITQNPNYASGILGAGLGGGAMYGADSYGDYRRRKALENANFMERLALAFQLATNPNGFSNTLRL